MCIIGRSREISHVYNWEIKGGNLSVQTVMSREASHLYNREIKGDKSFYWGI